VRKTKDDGMTTKRLGWGFAAMVVVLAAVVVPSTVTFADATTCYTGCTPPVLGGGGGGGAGGAGSGSGPVTKSSGSGSSGSGSAGSSGSQGQTVSTASSSGGSLPFTGADVEELSVIGAGALVAGGVLVRRGRRRRRAEV
jgi:hypothetical protein